ncbi:MAG: type II secretion system protein [Patescibacteria group bacterium]
MKKVIIMTKNVNIEKYKQGFGILEVLVSAVIIITILSVLVFIGRSALANSLYAQGKAQAIYIAQEGIEQVRQARDTNWIDGDNTTQFDDVAWNTAINDLVQPTAGTVYAPNYALNRWGLKATTTGSSDTNILILGQTYRREVRISTLGSSTIMAGSGSNDVNKSTQSFKVTVKVMWDLNGQTKNVEVSEILTNWRPNF